jgi:predicted RNA-binding Zn ribbon-like protein
MPEPFQLLAEHPALDFVNTLDNRFSAAGPKELLNNYGDLLQFGAESGALDAKSSAALALRCNDSAARKVLRSALKVREALASAFYGSIDADEKIPPEALQTLELQSLLAVRNRRLVRRPARSKRKLPISWEWSAGAPALDLPVWRIAQSGVDLLTSDEMRNVRACASDGCRWLFLDISKNHSRRWCSMAVCGNRMKANRFHARRVSACQ